MLLLMAAWLPTWQRQRGKKQLKVDGIIILGLSRRAGDRAGEVGGEEPERTLPEERGAAPRQGATGRAQQQPRTPGGTGTQVP